MTKTHTLTIRVPEEITKELSELENSRYFRKQLKGKKKDEIIKGFDEVMGKIKAREVEDWDTI